MRIVYDWNLEKNKKLVRERGVSFEVMVSQIESGCVIQVNDGKGIFAHQKQYLVEWNDYIYIVPYVESADKVFLKTIIPSRKWTKRYLSGEK